MQAATQYFGERVFINRSWNCYVKITGPYWRGTTLIDGKSLAEEQKCILNKIGAG